MCVCVCVFRLIGANDGEVICAIQLEVRSSMLEVVGIIFAGSVVEYVVRLVDAS